MNNIVTKLSELQQIQDGCQIVKKAANLGFDVTK